VVRTGSGGVASSSGSAPICSEADRADLGDADDPGADGLLLGFF
jgi:hypothetical protein